MSGHDGCCEILKCQWHYPTHKQKRDAPAAFSGCDKCP